MSRHNLSRRVKLHLKRKEDEEDTNIYSGLLDEDLAVFFMEGNI